MIVIDIDIDQILFQFPNCKYFLCFLFFLNFFVAGGSCVADSERHVRVYPVEILVPDFGSAGGYVFELDPDLTLAACV